jgi:hypothetical protein
MADDAVAWLGTHAAAVDAATMFLKVKLGPRRHAQQWTDDWLHCD